MYFLSVKEKIGIAFFKIIHKVDVVNTCISATITSGQQNVPVERQQQGKSSVLLKPLLESAKKIFAVLPYRTSSLIFIAAAQLKVPLGAPPGRDSNT